MDHNEAVRQKATEKYLLEELEPERRDEFEEHLFDCQDCALDLRSAAMFVEQTKVVLGKVPAVAPLAARIEPRPVQPQPAGWLAWFRPAFALPALALLLMVLAYQNFIVLPHLTEAANQPQLVPWASVNVSTRGADGTAITTRRGEGFSLLLNLPPEDGLASYQADLYNPGGKLEWSGAISAPAAEQGRIIFIPGNDRRSGTYTLVIRGITSTGESKEISRHPIDLQIQN
jgi:Putative zinc-finger